MSRLTFLYQMDLPHRAVAVYVYLYDRANKNGECWPSVSTIAKEIKLSRIYAEQDLLKLLKDTELKEVRVHCYIGLGK